jgi:hypothetical protein
LKRYKIDLNGEQLQVLLKALEAYNRLCLAQFDYAIEQSTIDIPVDKMQDLKDLCDEIKMRLTGLPKNSSYGIGSKKYTEPARIAHDIYEVLRNYRAWDDRPEGGVGVDFSPPYKIGAEPLVTIKRTDSDVTDDGWLRKKPDEDGKYQIKMPQASHTPNDVVVKKGIVINGKVKVALSAITDDLYLWKKL